MQQVYPRSNCLVVSTENITQNWYFGNQRSMLIPNCLFRAGGAAMLLSNKASDFWRAKCALLSFPSAPHPPYLPHACTALSNCLCIRAPRGNACMHGSQVKMVMSEDAMCLTPSFMSCARRYELLHVVRTHQGASEDSYKCVYQQEDADGKVGVHLSKELMAIAGRSLKANITTLAPLVLPQGARNFLLSFLIDLDAMLLRRTSMGPAPARGL